MSALFDVPATKADLDLPAIIGSDRQIPWATDIRGKKIAEAENLITQMQGVEAAHRRSGKTELADTQREHLTAAIEALEALKQKPYASFWIRRRDNTAMELLTGAEENPGDTWSHRDGRPA